MRARSSGTFVEEGSLGHPLYTINNSGCMNLCFSNIEARPAIPNSQIRSCSLTFSFSSRNEYAATRYGSIFCKLSGALGNRHEPRSQGILKRVLAIFPSYFTLPIFSSRDISRLRVITRGYRKLLVYRVEKCFVLRNVKLFDAECKYSSSTSCDYWVLKVSMIRLTLKACFMAKVTIFNCPNIVLTSN